MNNMPKYKQCQSCFFSMDVCDRFIFAAVFDFMVKHDYSFFSDPFIENDITEENTDLENSLYITEIQF